MEIGATTGRQMGRKQIRDGKILGVDWWSKEVTRSPI